MGLLSSLKDIAKDAVNELLDNNNEPSEEMDEELALEAGESSSTPAPMTKNPNSITSLDEMSSWLSTLEEGASASVQEAVKAQMQVIKFISSPTLVDTTLDTLILGLKKALKKANTEEEKETMREQFSLMIQNYVFFFDARMQYAINSNKDEARQIFLQAGEMLSNSVKDVALMTVTTPAKKAQIAAITVKNLFDTENNKSAFNLFNRIWKWWNADEIIAEKKEEFYSTLYNICKKLGKYQEMIGESMLINGMIERYTPAIYEYAAQQLLEQNNLEDWKERMEGIEDSRQSFLQGVDNQIRYAQNRGIDFEEITFSAWASGILLVGSLVVGLFRWIVKLVAGTNTEHWFATQMIWVGIIIGILLGGWLLYEIIAIIVSRIYAKKLIANRDNEIASINKRFDDQRDELQQQVNAVTQQAQDIAIELQQIAEAYNEI